jgi:hypothetical protein
MLSDPRKYFEFLNKSTVSMLKVEKVLRPPMMPVVRNRATVGFRAVEFLLRYTKKPQKNPANILEIKVPRGKIVVKWLMNREIE